MRSLYRRISYVIRGICHCNVNFIRYYTPMRVKDVSRGFTQYLEISIQVEVGRSETHTESRCIIFNYDAEKLRVKGEYNGILQCLQKLYAHSERQAFPSCFCVSSDQWKRKVDLKPRDGVCVNHAKTCRTGWQTVLERCYCPPHVA